MSLPRVRVWNRYRLRAIAGVKGNFRHSHVNNMGCKLCSQDSDETQEHLQVCEGTKFERKGLVISDWSLVHSILIIFLINHADIKIK